MLNDRRLDRVATAASSVAELPQMLGQGLITMLSLGNAVSRPLSDADTARILDRAESLWPEELLRFINDGDDAHP